MLLTRVLSSLGLLLPGVGAVYLGGAFFQGVIALCAAVLVWEWLSLCRAPRPGAAATVLVAFMLGAVLCAAVAAWSWALGLVAGGTAATAFVARLERRSHPAWIGAGALYIGFPALALIWLRDDPVHGLSTVSWLLATVVATDIGGYVVGKTVGGPRLAPVISPRKTWAGVAGGFAFAAAVGAVSALFTGSLAVLPFVAASVCVSAVAQGGDLLESAFKRHFGVKDTSAIIPGHGGLFDRVDGLIAASVGVAALRLVSGGSIFAWL